MKTWLMALSVVLFVQPGCATAPAPASFATQQKTPSPRLPHVAGKKLDPEAPNPFRYNQVGYLPDATKRFVVVDNPCTTFQLETAEGQTIFEAALSDRGTWIQSGEHICGGDFSAVVNQGNYRLVLEDGRKSALFAIRENLFVAPLRDALRTFYFQRASVAIDPEHGGPYARELGHPDNQVFLDETTGDKGIISSPGGWYDAGDYGKYTVNAGITVSTMLDLFWLAPNVAPDGFSNIPESGNGQSDLLDEVRFELAWLATMQAGDGGVYFKLGPKAWPDFIMPAKDTSKRWVMGKATSGTLIFTALMAKASMIYSSIDPSFAADCLKRAKRAWTWAVAHPAVFPPEKTEGTGGYPAEQHSWIDTTCAEPTYLKTGPSVFDDEFLYAATELFVATGDSSYRKPVQQELTTPTLSALPAWWETTALAYYTLYLHEDRLTSKERTKVESGILSLATTYLTKLESSPYRIPYDCFYWGSAASFGNAAVLFAFAHQISKEDKWMDALVETVDTLFGKNSAGTSFVTGYGSKSPLHIHHRPSGADDVLAPIPGFLVGGPNRLRQDDISKSQWGVTYQSHRPAKSYVDDQQSYASNEVAINWTAPLVFALGILSKDNR